MSPSSQQLSRGSIFGHLAKVCTSHLKVSVWADTASFHKDTKNPWAGYGGVRRGDNSVFPKQKGTWRAMWSTPLIVVSEGHLEEDTTLRNL